MSDEIVNFYSDYDEKNRLVSDFSLERIRSEEIISRELPPGSLKILDVGGATGVYSFWLAGLGHQVSLIDLTPKHVEQAKTANEGATHKLRSISEGNATSLSFQNDTFDVVLLMGPLYHLQEEQLRIRALQEALRVLKLGGKLIFACISRFASLVDGFQFGLVADPKFREILDHDLETGNHINRTGNPSYFTDAHLHLPEEIEQELRSAGSSQCQLYAVEGFGSIIHDLETKMKDFEFREYFLERIRETEQERSILGISSHFIGVVTKVATF